MRPEQERTADIVRAHDCDSSRLIAILQAEMFRCRQGMTDETNGVVNAKPFEPRPGKAIEDHQAVPQIRRQPDVFQILVAQPVLTSGAFPLCMKGKPAVTKHREF